jgi:hypothetical protein
MSRIDSRFGALVAGSARTERKIEDLEYRARETRRSRAASTTTSLSAKDIDFAALVQQVDALVTEIAEIREAQTRISISVREIHTHLIANSPKSGSDSQTDQ